MGFVYEGGVSAINEEQKVRITLSPRAVITMHDDMSVFGITKAASFINTVFTNYRSDAESSICLRLEQRRMELEQLFRNTKMRSADVNTSIQLLLASEEKELIRKKNDRIAIKGSGMLYHINKENVEYLCEDSNEEGFYDLRPGLYLRAVLEEYCALPFIDRVRIFRKEVYDIVNQAIAQKKLLKIRAEINRVEHIFHVYPYKIVSDPLHSQSYLVCYTKKPEESDSQKIVASFSMTKMKTPAILFSKSFYLNKSEISYLEKQLTENSAAYLLGKPQKIKVKLTPNGKRLYQFRLHSRPEKDEAASTDKVYVFDCSQYQAFNYFFGFGPDAEIISPKELRERFRSTYENALKNYSKRNK